MQLGFVVLWAGSCSQSQTDCCGMLYELVFKIMILLWLCSSLETKCHLWWKYKLKNNKKKNKTEMLLFLCLWIHYLNFMNHYKQPCLICVTIDLRLSFMSYSKEPVYQWKCFCSNSYWVKSPFSKHWIKLCVIFQFYAWISVKCPTSNAWHTGCCALRIDGRWPATRCFRSMPH